MPIVGGLDLHRKQVTFDVVDTGTGVYEPGRIVPADRESFRCWLAGFEGQRHRRQHHMLDGLERPSVCTPRPRGAPHRSSCRRAAGPFVHRDKPGRPRTRPLTRVA